MNQDNVCKRIRELRIEKGFSQKYVGEQCGLTQQAINRIEQGNRKIDIDLLFRISHALGVDMFKDILTTRYDERTVFDVDDESLTRYIESIGYSLTLLDDQEYLLSNGVRSCKIPYKARATLFTEIDDYVIYKIDKIIKTYQNNEPVT